MEFTIRRSVQDDWQQFRAIRLEMLADTPMGFGERLEAAEKYGEPEWRHRTARIGNENARFAAIDESGDWIGTMGGYLDKEVGGPMLYGVYVTPRYRGDAFGVTDALLSTVEEWAVDYAPTLWLDVHADNLRAQAAYAKRGFVMTGKTLPYDLNPGELEFEMIKRLR
jgi:GNAT superfamily N-acetyltransferase